MYQTLKRIGRRMLGGVVDDDGPTATEYAVLLALIVVMCMGAARAIGEGWNAKIFAQLAGKLPF
jgi:pilus assembly protein Flp/PilA